MYERDTKTGCRETSFLIIHLYSVFWQVGLQAQHLPGVHVRVVGVLECFLQLLQLVGGEYRAVSPLFLLLLPAEHRAAQRRLVKFSCRETVSKGQKTGLWQ